MQNVSQNYLDFINDNNNIGRSMKNKVVIDNVEYFSDIIKSNPKISHKATSFIGGFPAKTCEFEILNIDNSISLNNKEIEIYKGLELNGSIEWVKMGIFKAKDEDITNNLSSKSISFKGTDRRTLFDDIYKSDLPYPATGLQIIQDICNTLGVTLETTNFNMANYTWNKKPNFNEATTFTEAVARIAEAGGEIAYISNNGGLRIVGQTATGQTIPKSKRGTLTREKQFGPINSVVLGKAGYDDNIVSQNTVMQNTGAGKNKIDISKYEKTSYHQGDFVLNGDTLKITVNKVYSAINNFIVQYKIQLKPNTKYTFSWDCNKSNDAQAARWYFYADKLWGSKSLGSGAENGLSRTITTDETGLVVAGLYITTNVVVGDTITISNLQMEEGSSKTSYEEGKAAGVIEWKITDNPYFDLNREEIVETIANNIIGKSVIPYTIENFVDDFIYDLNDVISVVDNNGNTFNAVILQYETTSRIKSKIAVPAQTETSTNYNVAGNKNSNKISNSVKLLVNHLEQVIEAIASKLIDTSSYIDVVGGIGIVHLKDTAKSKAMIKKLTIKGFAAQELYLSDTTYLNDNTYLGNISYLNATTDYCITIKKANTVYDETTGNLIIVDGSYDAENEEITSPDDYFTYNDEELENEIYKHYIHLSEPLKSGVFNGISVHDELVIENNKCYIIRRLGSYKNGNSYVLDEVITEEYGELELETIDGNTFISVDNFTGLQFECDYMKKNDYCDYYATEVLYNSNFTLTNENISSKVNKNNIISEINQTAELVKILANKIQLEGYTTINGGFAVDLEGNASIANGAVNINNRGIQMKNGTQIVGGDGMLTNLQYMGTAISASTGKTGDFDFIGAIANDLAEVNQKTYIQMFVDIPAGFTIKKAVITLYHQPVKYGYYANENDMYNNEYSYAWGYTRNIGLFKSEPDESIVTYVNSEYFETDPSVNEISGAFGANGFTPSEPNDNNAKLEVIQSADFASELEAGTTNRLIIQSRNDVPAYNQDTYTNDYNCLKVTGRLLAVLDIYGYMNI